MTLGKKREIKEIPYVEEKTKKILIPKCQVDYDIVTNEKLTHIHIDKKPKKVIPPSPTHRITIFRNSRS